MGLAPTVWQAIFDALDPRLAPELRRALQERRKQRASGPPPSRGGAWVLAGHRAAGKSTLLPLIARLSGLPALDLDRELEQRHGRLLRDWVKEDAASFRKAERSLFSELAEPGTLIAVGGGFLALHPDLLTDHTPVVIPLTFETYRERLLADVSRPRLRPDLTAEEEIAAVFHERETLHRRSGALSLVDFLAAIPEEPIR